MKIYTFGAEDAPVLLLLPGTRCPICSYARNLGVSELMPLFCELDEVMITLQHGVLHRRQTLANGGEYCDYFITGNKEQP